MGRMTSTLAQRLTDDSVFRNFRNRSIGYDSLFERMFSTGDLHNLPASFPHYNILQSSPHHFRIEVALAGFSKSDINVQFCNGILSILNAPEAVPNVNSDSSRYDETLDKRGASCSAVQYIHRGIAKRQFELRFQLSHQVKIEEARMENGILTISLVDENHQAKMMPIEIK